jgi:hypothetical protein
MNEYGQMALEHWRRFRPRDFANLTDRESFFAQLGRQAADEIETRTQQLAGSGPSSESYMDNLRRIETARRQARDQVIRELLLATPEDEENEQSEAQTPHQA